MNFTTNMNSEHLMTVNGCTVGLNMPDALKSTFNGKEEMAHGLPPHNPRRAYLVDEYPACPKDWLRSTGRIKSYFVPIIEGAGLWLDFNYCGGNHVNHVGVVTSVQGVNAITGLPTKDTALEQYRDQCPKHKKAFGPDRLCSDCGFKWPKQNYLASTGQPHGQMWLDGFRAEDGYIRQYVFTAQKMRGIANAVIGEDRVFALGLSFYLSKEPRPKVQHNILRSFGGVSHISTDSLSYTIPNAQNSADYENSCLGVYSASVMDDGDNNDVSISSMDMYCGPKGDKGPVGPVGPKGVEGPHGIFYSGLINGKATNSSSSLSAKKQADYGSMMRCVSVPSKAAKSHAAPRAINSVKVQQLEVAAGARIAQHIHDDPNDLDYWQKEPEGIIIVNYVTEADAEKIIAAGKIDLSGHKEGFMQALPTGN